MSTWPTVRLGEVTESMKNGIYKPASAYAEDGYACLRMYNIGDGKLVWRDIKRMRLSKNELSEYRLLPGDLLVNRVNSRELVGKTAVIPEGVEPLVFESKNIRLRLVPDKANPKFINYQLLLNGRRHFSTNAQQVVGMASINQKQLADFPVMLPLLSVQEEAVAEIEKQFSRLDEAVANLKRVKANLKRYKASVLKAAVEGKLAPTERPWKQVVLGDIATSIRNGYSKKPDAEQGTRIFRISAVRPMKLDVNDIRYLSGNPADYQSFLIESGDVLFTRYNGSRDYVGVCARVPPHLPPTAYPDKLIRVRVPAAMLLPEFLVILASTGRAREYIESKIRTTAGQSGISGGDLKSLPLDIPWVTEQQQIVAEAERRLSVIGEVEAAVEANLTRSDRLRQSVLQQAFEGRLARTCV